MLKRIRPGSRVYFAGRVTAPHDWRSQFAEQPDTPDLSGLKAVRVSVDGRFTYVGPWLCTGGEGAGRSKPDTGFLDQRRLCISQADVVFAWIDRADASEVFIDIGMACGMGKPVFLALARDQVEATDLWLVVASSAACVEAETPLEAWRILTNTEGGEAEGA